MAAIATSKPGAAMATQLTFPAVYSSVYASRGIPLAYAPSGRGPVVSPTAGDDFQSHYHAQKKVDADYMARQKVVSTRNATTRALTGPHGYHVPPAELGQRVYANPANGVGGSFSSARQDGGVPAPFQLIDTTFSDGSRPREKLSGGVLRTAEGQAYGKARLTARIGQLNAMDAEKVAFTTGERLAPTGPAPLPPGVVSDALSDSAKIELQLLLQSILDALMGSRAEREQEAGGDELSRFTFGDSVRAVNLIVRYATSADAESLEDVLAPVESILQLLDGLMDPDRAEQVERSAMAEERLTTTYQLWKRIGEYVRAMMGGVNLSPRDRVALSKSLVNSLGFLKFVRDIQNAKVESRGLFERISRGRMFDARGRQAMDDDDDDDADDVFDGPGERREDSEQSRSRAEFDGDERQSFGYASGSFLGAPAQQGREAPAYLGEMPDDLPSMRVPSAAGPRGAAPASRASSEIRSVFDPVLGARGVEVRRPASVRSARSAPAVAVSALPSKQSQLPTTREGFIALARALNAAGGIDGKPVVVYSKGKLENIRRNFIRRLGLAGKF